MQDKISRLINISKTGVNLVDDESLRDTLVDLSNYALMGVMCMDDAKEAEKSACYCESLRDEPVYKDIAGFCAICKQTWGGKGPRDQTAKN